MKPFFCLLIFVLTVTTVRAQSLVGTWQLVKQTSCLNDELGAEDPEMEALIADMENSSSTGTNYVMRFKDEINGEENIRMTGSRKSSRLNNFMYKFDGNNLYLLDKKSRLLLGSYYIESLTADSLIFSHAKRACETRIFVKISDK